MKSCTDHVKQRKAIVDISLLLQLFENKCKIESCSSKCEVCRCKTVGCVVTIEWRCSMGHFGSWSSSKVLCQKKKQNVFTNNVMIAAGRVSTLLEISMIYGYSAMKWNFDGSEKFMEILWKFQHSLIEYLFH